MATAEELTKLYKTIPQDNVNKQTEFNVILTKVFYLTEQGHAIDMSSKDDFDKNFSQYDNVKNIRTDAKDMQSQLLKDKIQSMINIFKQNDTGKRLERIQAKIKAITEYAKNNSKPLPTIEDFKRVLDGAPKAAALTWTPSANRMADPFANFMKNMPYAVRAASPPPPPSKTAAAAAKPLPPVVPRTAPEPRWKAECRKSEVVAASETAKKFVRNPARVRNLFPGTDLRTLHTLDALNAFIEENYRDRLGPEVDRTKSTRPLGSYMSTFSQYSFSDYECMESAGSNSDCLIHSFLTATCPAFRSLTSRETRTGNDKNEFATWFRQYVYPTLPSVARQIQDTTDDFYTPSAATSLCLTTGEILKYRIFTPNEFLSDQDLGKLCMDYRIHAILFQGRDELGQQTMTFSGPDLTNPRARVYIIGNAVGVHYESVRTPDGSYTISGETAFKINQIIREPFIYEGFNGMRDPGTIRQGATTYGIQLAAGRTAGELKQNIRTTIAAAKRDMRRGAAAAPAPPPEAAAPNTPNVNTYNRDTYIAVSLSHPAANNMRKAGLSDEELSEQYGQLWNTAKSRRNAARKKQEANNAAFARQLAAGVSGGGRRKRTAKALRHRRSLRAKRNHSSKGKRHGSRRKR